MVVVVIVVVVVVVVDVCLFVADVVVIEVIVVVVVVVVLFFLFFVVVSVLILFTRLLPFPFRSRGRNLRHPYHDFCCEIVDDPRQKQLVSPAKSPVDDLSSRASASSPLAELSRLPSPRNRHWHHRRNWSRCYRYLLPPPVGYRDLT